MNPLVFCAALAICGWWLLVHDARKLRRELREIAADDRDQRSKSAQQEWLVVRNLRMRFPIDACPSAVGFIGMLVWWWPMARRELANVIFGVALFVIVATSYVWSFRGLPAPLRRWFFDFSTR